MRLAIFCSSKPALVSIFKQNIEELMKGLEASGIFTHFVYGGGTSGIMGLVREYATLPVVGHNLPRWDPLEDEAVYNTLRERQNGLIDDSDAYLILAGGVGTMYELFQVLCENDVEKKRKPVMIYDPLLVYEPLEELLRRMHKNNYITAPPEVSFHRTVEDLLTSLDQIVSK